MITLYAFGPALGLPDPSPFVMKAEMLLKLAGLEYRTVVGNMRQAPKGKLPYIEDDGEKIADSTFIRWHIEKKYRFDFDRHLTPAGKGIAWATEKLLEDHLYWLLVQDRWMDDSNFKRGPARLFDSVPWPLRSLVVRLVRRQVRTNLHGQGTGRHGAKELAQLAAHGIAALAAILGDQPYLMGAQPCGADATAFAFTAHLMCPVFASPLHEAALAHPNLVAYSHRMMQAYYPNLASATPQ